ncbi:hypothetical protein [Brevibacillus laterosporus]|uniref:hypothetical protein n=1 Tax=Brevibacillus laterosporus TaxID=1465 RepID=UPI002E1E7F81|nr:hypothetical protein [Brevibacillus laterosporus]MED1667813.1 hypothetical protein [Brevibacillus laterosporus]MED1719602.1 hypothetical protein [Brevibacillus laterosporus]
MKKQTYLMFPLMTSLLVTGCGPAAISGNVNEVVPQNNQTVAAYKAFTFDVDPETFEVWVMKDGVKERVSEPLAKQTVTNLTKTADAVSWTYPDQQVKVKLTKGKNDLHVKITSTASSPNPFIKASSLLIIDGTEEIVYQ